MENESSKSVSQVQNYPAVNLSHEQTTKPLRNKHESNSRLLPREKTEKRSHKSSMQDAAPQAKNIGSAFLGAVNLGYPKRKSSVLKRFKECSLSPCSEEFRFVMQGFKGADEQPAKSIAAPQKRSKNRKTSFNDFTRATKYSSTKLPSEFESDIPPFRPRPRGYTLPARISEVSRDPLETQLDGKTDAMPNKLHVFDAALSSNVKLAWQEFEINDNLKFSAKKERRKFVSLSYPLERQHFDNKHEESEGKFSGETSNTPQCSEFVPGRGKPSTGKETQRKKAQIDLPKIYDLQVKRSGAKISADGIQRKISTADQMKAGHGESSKTELQRGGNWLASHPSRPRSYSNESFTDNKETGIKQKLSFSLSVPGTYHCKSPAISLTPLLNLKNDDVESEMLSDKPTIRRTDQFSIKRAHLRRVGKATLAATRLLKIRYRENGIREAVTIKPEQKELDELFEEMKDCRYLRKSSSEMRT